LEKQPADTPILDFRSHLFRTGKLVVNFPKFEVLKLTLNAKVLHVAGQQFAGLLV